MAGQHVLLWYAIYNALSPWYWLLMHCRLPRLGVSYESTPPASPSGKVFLILHHNVGPGPLLHGSGEELLRRHCRSLFPRGI